nr:MAG TPA: hypothetical protein [Caudoviricetes sp.]
MCLHGVLLSSRRKGREQVTGKLEEVALSASDRNRRAVRRECRKGTGTDTTATSCRATISVHRK